jgi:hypothetical protein
MHDDDEIGRDARGRWTKGHCPNPNGRPRKKIPISESDVHHFKQTMVDAVIGGKQTQMTRHALLLHKMFEQALKGSVLTQRKLFERFEKSDDTIVEAELELKHLGRQILARHDKTGTIDEQLYEEYRQLYALLRGRPHHEAVNEPVRRPRDRRKPAPSPPTWRKGPKPQAILDLEAEWAAAEAAEKAARAKKKTEGSDEH